MLPKTHIILGAIFSSVIWTVFPNIAWYNIGLIFLASFLIDFDHYMCAAIDDKSWSLPKALKYYNNMIKIEQKEFERGIRRRGNFHVFHTLEFHALVLALGLIFQPFLYIFLGMIFHSMLDILSMGYLGRLYRREFFLTHWVKSHCCKY